MVVHPYYDRDEIQSYLLQPKNGLVLRLATVKVPPRVYESMFTVLYNINIHLQFMASKYIDTSLPPKLPNLIVGQRDVYEGLAGFIEEFVQRVEYPSQLHTYRSAAK